MSGLGSFIPHPIYDDYRKIYVWQKGLLIPGQDPTLWRYDDYYMVIKWSDYGDRSSVYGWEIDHCIPSSFGGADDISNLRPLNWFNNARYEGALSNLPNLTTHQFESFPRVVAVGDKTGSFEQCISARG